MELKNISDTALWVAVYRANETKRKDAVFKDPYAAKLAGERGVKIAKEFTKHSEWSIITRTYLIDQMIQEEISRGTDTIINLAAGLDSRPYRMDLPKNLRWIEVDLPDLLTYKEEILKDDKPVCKLERVRLDLSNAEKRIELLQKIGRESKRVTVITEGLLIYLTEEMVTSLAKDFHSVDAIKGWILEVHTPALITMINKKVGHKLEAANAPFKFAAKGGVDFYHPLGWKPLRAESLFKTASKIKRLSFFMNLMSKLPETEKSRREKPWAAVCLMERI